MTLDKDLLAKFANPNADEEEKRKKAYLEQELNRVLSSQNVAQLQKFRDKYFELLMWDQKERLGNLIENLEEVAESTRVDQESKGLLKKQQDEESERQRKAQEKKWNEEKSKKVATERERNSQLFTFKGAPRTDRSQQKESMRIQLCDLNGKVVLKVCCHCVRIKQGKFLGGWKVGEEMCLRSDADGWIDALISENSYGVVLSSLEFNGNQFNLTTKEGIKRLNIFFPGHKSLETWGNDWSMRTASSHNMDDKSFDHFNTKIIGVVFHNF